MRYLLCGFIACFPAIAWGECDSCGSGSCGSRDIPQANFPAPPPPLVQHVDPVPQKIRGAIARIYNNTMPGQQLVLTCTLIEKTQDSATVLTCAHGLRGLDTSTLIVSFPGRIRFRGELIAVHPTLDLAVVRVLGRPAGQPVALASDFPRVGASVSSFGYGKTGNLSGGFARVQYYTPNRSSSRSRDIASMRINRPSQEGDSGGPVFDSQWRLCGVIYASDLVTSLEATEALHVNRFVTTALKQKPMQARRRLRECPPEDEQPPPLVAVPPKPEPIDPEPEPEVVTKDCDDCKKLVAELEAKVNALQVQIVNIQTVAGAKGEQGERGEQGPTGASVDTTKLVDTVVDRLKDLPITFQKLDDSGTKVLSQHKAYLGDYVGLVREKK